MSLFLIILNLNQALSDHVSPLAPDSPRASSGHLIIIQRHSSASSPPVCFCFACCGHLFLFLFCFSSRLVTAGSFNAAQPISGPDKRVSVSQQLMQLQDSTEESVGRGAVTQQGHVGEREKASQQGGVKRRPISQKRN